MSLTHSRRGRPVIACDYPGCPVRFRVRSPGETIVVLRLRASLRGWWRKGRWEFCPRHLHPPMRPRRGLGVRR